MRTTQVERRWKGQGRRGGRRKEGRARRKVVGGRGETNVSEIGGEEWCWTVSE